MRSFVMFTLLVASIYAGAAFYGISLVDAHVAASIASETGQYGVR